jgi:hypothetical protein
MLNLLKILKELIKEKYESDKKDPRGPMCFECSGNGHIHADCSSLKQSAK